MKRILALFLTAALLLSLLCACTGGGDPADTVIPSDPDGASAPVPSEDVSQEPSLALPGGEPSAEVPEEPSPEVPDEPSGEPDPGPSPAPPSPAPAPSSPAPAPSPAPSSPAPAPSPAPASPAPADPEPSPTVPGGGIIIPGLGGDSNPTPSAGQPAGDVYEPTGPSASDVNMTHFYQSVISSYAFPEMDTPPSTEWLSNYIPGLVNIPVVQRSVFIPRATSNGVEIVLVQVTDSSNVSAVKSALQAHIDYKASDFDYPQVMDAWQNNARVVSSGNYIMLIVHSEYEAIIADFNAQF